MLIHTTTPGAAAETPSPLFRFESAGSLSRWVIPESTSMRSHTCTRQRAFTLIEILVVVVILGILSAVVIPQFTNARVDASVSTVKSQLQTVRGQIEVYKARHSALPALGTNGNASDWDPLVNPPDEDVYLQAAPYNPFTGSAGIGDVDSINIGWVWDEVTGVIAAPYFDEITSTYNPPG